MSKDLPKTIFFFPSIQTMTTRQPLTLYSIILHNYTYEQVRDLCSSAENKLVFDCEWGVWRDKAVADFDVSPEFFDLVRSLGASNGIRTLSGSQRYLQIASYVKLSPLSAVRVLPGGQIEGVYESIKGIRVAKERKDARAMMFFAQRASQQRRDNEYIERAKVQSVFFPMDLFTPASDIMALYKKLVRDVGIDKALRQIFELPKDFSLSDIPRPRFWLPFPKLDLPLYDVSDEDAKDFFVMSLHSGDARLVVFFMTIFGDKDLYTWAAAEKFGYDFLLKGNPEDAYTITQRFRPEAQARGKERDLNFMSELYLPFAARSAGLIPDNVMGDIAFLMAILPLLPPSMLEFILPSWESKHGKDYPLSLKLIRERSKEQDS
ncbi:hypothetical protein BQ9231_00439 [Cedratvirus lausannensis]|uniref:Uncharacterized protein n=1 Tax=Cedratvirus lausannensis TaxID=2023205 RepID=A0A285PYP1_9VIRU|nr:hypothetical protein BQ9231_00439 [Cedratvirus lausannensis]